MISRYLGARTGLARAALTATALLSTAVMADGPRYTYIGASYEWTDVKYAVDPSQDPNFNNGTIEGVNLDASLGIMGFFHIIGQYFQGDCKKCGNWVDNNTNQVNTYDLTTKGYKLGLGGNLGFDVIGLNEDSPAAHAGVEAGWVVTEVGGIPVGTKAQVVDALGTLGDQPEVEFSFRTLPGE